MPEIKIKHVVSFSSEDKVHKAENMLKSETYRKWKCATPGEKNASIVLQFEKATQIHSIDIGNECSAFVEVLVGRSSDTLNDYQVLLVASSFMSPLESRNETHTNRVRMFGPDTLSQNLKNEKWDCVQVVCTQPFNKNITYGLSFIKFHSPPLPPSAAEESKKDFEVKPAALKLGAFKIKSEDEDNSLPSVGSFFGKRKFSENSPVSSSQKESSTYAAAVLASASITPKRPAPQVTPLKRKHNEVEKELQEIRTKRESPRPSKEQIVLQTSLKKSNERVVEKKTSPSASSSRMEQVKRKRPFSEIMKKVVFVLSGFVNPLRSELRDKALKMGGRYKADWDSSCTHLICAFLNTPKYAQVRAAGGRIVSKDWIIDCYKKKDLLPWRQYMLGKYSFESTDESDPEPQAAALKRNVERSSKLNGTPSSENKGILGTPFHQNTDLSSSDLNVGNNKNANQSINIKDESETEDEDAIEDYIAETDVESDSGGDTEDEIRKVQSKIARKKLHMKSSNERKTASQSEVFEKPNIDDLPLPDLPNLFKNRHFFLYGDFTVKKRHDLERYIVAYNGVLENYMSQNVKYVITESKWDEHFEEALAENEDLIFVRPQWIYKCHEMKKLVPYQPYITIPDT